MTRAPWRFFNYPKPRLAVSTATVSCRNRPTRSGSPRTPHFITPSPLRQAGPSRPDLTQDPLQSTSRTSQPGVWGRPTHLGHRAPPSPPQARTGPRQPSLQLQKHSHGTVRSPGAAPLSLALRSSPRPENQGRASSGARLTTSTLFPPKEPPQSSSAKSDRHPRRRCVRRRRMKTSLRELERGSRMTIRMTSRSRKSVWQGP